MGWSCFKGNWSVAPFSRLFFLFFLTSSEGCTTTRLKECHSVALNVWQWMHFGWDAARKSARGGSGRVPRVGCGGGEEQWSEKWERCWGSLARRLGRRRQCDDGWGGKWWMKKEEEEGKKQKGEGRTRESNRAVLDTSAENTLASCQSGSARLIDSLLLFNQHFSLRSSFPSQCVLIPTLGFLPLLPLSLRSSSHQGQTLTVTSLLPKQWGVLGEM